MRKRAGRSSLKNLMAQVDNTARLLLAGFDESNGWSGPFGGRRSTGIAVGDLHQLLRARHGCFVRSVERFACCRDECRPCRDGCFSSFRRFFREAIDESQCSALLICASASAAKSA